MIHLDEQTLRDLAGQGLSVAQIAYAMATSAGTVQRNMVRLEIPRNGELGGDRKSARFKTNDYRSDAYSSGRLDPKTPAVGRDRADIVHRRQPNIILGISGAELTNCLVSNNRDAVFADEDPWQIGRQIKALVKEDGYHAKTESHDDVTPCYGADIIIAKPDGVWHLSSDFSLTAIKEGDLWAIGSGAEIAMGAGYVLGEQGITSPADWRVNAALRAACYWCRGCSAPFHVERLGKVNALSTPGRG